MHRPTRILRHESNKKFIQDIPIARGAAVNDRYAKLALYRECMLLSMAQKTAQLRKLSVEETRTEWRKRKFESGDVLRMAIANGLDRIEYVRMCTSRARIRELKVPAASTSYDWGLQQIAQGDIVKVSKRQESASPTTRAETHGKGYRDFVPMQNWGRGCLDPDHIRTHRELLDRQYFMGPHWRGKPKPLIYGDLSMEEQVVTHLTEQPNVKERVKKEF